jgi:hypothetical protein
LPIGAQEFEAGEQTLGGIQGRVYLVIDNREEPQPNALMVVPAGSEQPIAIDDLPGGDPATADQLEPARDGTGLVRAGNDGRYSVTGLAPGEYFVAIVTPLPGHYQAAPPEQVHISILGEVSTVRAFRASVIQGSTVNVDIVFGIPQPSGPATLELCATTYDRETLEQGPDTVVSVEIKPPAPEAVVTVDDETGCAVITNLPAGTYTFVIVTERGFTLTQEDVVLEAGSDGSISLGAAPPLPGSLPDTGSGNTGRSSWIAAVAALCTFAAGALVFGALRLKAG